MITNTQSFFIREYICSLFACLIEAYNFDLNFSLIEAYNFDFNVDI